MATRVIYLSNFLGVYSGSTSYSDAREGTGTAVLTGNGADLGQKLSAGTYYIDQQFMEFDVSGVGTATAATLAINAFSPVGSFTMEARAYDFGASITTADFVPGSSLSGLTLLGSRSTVGFTSGSYWDVTSDAALVTEINAQPSTLRLVLASAAQTSGTAPTASDDVTFGIYAGQGRLTVTDDSTASQTTISFPSGTGSVTAPAAAVAADVEVWGGGGSGAKQTTTTRRAAGGNGGNYAKSSIAVTGGVTTIWYSVGSPGGASDRKSVV